jgi:hypothetical protein
MKKSILAILIAFSILGCNDDFLERASLSQIAEDNFWTSQSDAFLALNGAYSALQSRSLYGGSLNGWQGYPGFDGLGDNSFNAFKWEGPGEFMEGNLNPENGPVLAHWTDLYRAIARVNSIIKNVQEISEDLVGANTKNELLGQAYFLRALCYFNLSVYFEEAPLITEPQTLEEAFVPKNTYQEITSQVIDDLKFSIENLPIKHSDNLYGYATQGAALGLFARVQLYNQEYAGEFGVLNLTQRMLALGYSLHTNYAELFTTANETSPEIVFSVRFFADVATNNGETFSGTFAGSPKADMRPMPNLVNDYYCTDGLPITTSPLYDSTNKGLNRDPRANASVYFKGDLYMLDLNRAFPGNGPTSFGQRKYIRNLNSDENGQSPFSEGSQDFYVLRYADVLLMRAEAMAETGDIPGATELINEIRARVGMPRIQDVEGTVNQTQMVEIVRHERRVELALEGLRFMDLKRWGTLEQAFTRALNDPVGPYNPQYLNSKSSVFPIPQNEIDVNPVLVQNPAW